MFSPLSCFSCKSIPIEIERVNDSNDENMSKEELETAKGIKEVLTYDSGHCNDLSGCNISNEQLEKILKYTGDYNKDHHPEMKIERLAALERRALYFKNNSIEKTIQIFQDHLQRLIERDGLRINEELSCKSCGQNNEPFTPLEAAAFYEAPALMEAIIRAGGVVQGFRGFYLMHPYLIYLTGSQLLKDQCVDVLIRNNWDLNRFDNRRFSSELSLPIMPSIWYNHDVTIISMLKAKANLNIFPSDKKDSDDVTILHHYVSLIRSPMKQDFDMVKIFIKYSAPDLFKMNSKGQTAADVARIYKKIELADYLDRVKTNYISIFSLHLPNVLCHIVNEYLWENAASFTKLQNKKNANEENNLIYLV